MARSQRGWRRKEKVTLKIRSDLKLESVVNRCIHAPVFPFLYTLNFLFYNNQINLTMPKTQFKVEVKGDALHIIIPITKRDSKSGKNITVASTNGNKVTDAIIDGQNVTIGINAYIPKD